MREAAEVLLRRRGQRDRFDAGGQGRDHVHDHRGRVDGKAAGDVEPHAGHRHPVLADDGAFAQFDVDVRRALGVGEAAGPADGLLQGRAHGGIQALKGRTQCLGRDAGVRLFDAVEGQCQLPESVDAPRADGGDDIQDLALSVGHGARLCPGHVK